jgi:hypothetical protein
MLRLNGRPALPKLFRSGFAVGIVSLDTAFHISDLLALQPRPAGGNDPRNKLVIGDFMRWF